MKKIFLLGILPSVVLLFSSCKKQEENCNLIPAKIIRYDCDKVIFQLITNENIGDANWEDVRTGQQYTNVVSYYNTCAIGAITNGNLATLYVNLKKTDENLFAQDCNQCLAVSQNPPQTKVDFISVSENQCDQRNLLK
jgi:hypothetical protein